MSTLPSSKSLDEHISGSSPLNLSMPLLSISRSSTNFVSKHVSSSTIKDYQKIKEIGSGSFGKTFYAKRTSDGYSVCLKFLKSKKEKHYQDLENEVTILKQLNHSNIVNYIDHFRYKDQLVIVMEYIEGIELKEKIESARIQNQPFSEEFICFIFSELISALSHCHSLHIIHRDIKPANILITKDNKIKLVDFGFSKQIEHTLKSAHSESGTMIYMSPEMFSEEIRYFLNTDIWSLGCILFELISLKHPFSYDPIQYMNLMCEQSVPNYNDLQCSNELISLVQRMLCYDPSQRISISELKISPFVLKYNLNTENESVNDFQEIHDTFDN
jgi:NIMA (never in mitosis gene a)-related kinase